MLVILKKSPKSINAGSFVKDTLLDLRVAVSGTSFNLAIKKENLIKAIEAQRMHAQKAVADFFKKSGFENGIKLEPGEYDIVHD